MYNAIFGDGERGYPLLGALGFSKLEDVGRYRDAWIEKDGQGGYRIAVYTRNGGNNREDYMPDFSGNPYFLFDQDDEFDNTYATIYFSVPPELLKMVEAAIAQGAEIPEPVDMDQEWQTAIKALENNLGGRQDEVMANMDKYVKVVSIDPETGTTKEVPLSGLVEELTGEASPPKE